MFHELLPRQHLSAHHAKQRPETYVDKPFELEKSHGRDAPLHQRLLERTEGQLHSRQPWLRQSTTEGSRPANAFGATSTQRSDQADRRMGPLRSASQLRLKSNGVMQSLLPHVGELQSRLHARATPCRASRYGLRHRTETKVGQR
jgi:hypothetical protein